MLDRLHAERDLERRRAAIFGFPGPGRGAEPPLAAVSRTRSQRGYEAAPLLRGVYFTSGTQEGTPIDRLLAGMAQASASARAGPSACSGNRSFFLTRLLREVVFAEAGLVARDVGGSAASVRSAGRLGRSGLLTCGMTAALGGWPTSTIAIAARRSRRPGRRGRTGTGRRRQPNCRRRTALLLRSCRPRRAGARLPDSPSRRRTCRPLADRPRPVAAGAARRLRHRSVSARRSSELFCRRLVLRMEDQLRANINDPEFVLEGLKVYLMLGGQASLDPDLVATWFRSSTVAPRRFAGPRARATARPCRGARGGAAAARTQARAQRCTGRPRARDAPANPAGPARLSARCPARLGPKPSGRGGSAIMPGPRPRRRWSAARDAA